MIELQDQQNPRFAGDDLIEVEVGRGIKNHLKYTFRFMDKKDWLFTGLLMPIGIALTASGIMNRDFILMTSGFMTTGSTIYTMNEMAKLNVIKRNVETLHDYWERRHPYF